MRTIGQRELRNDNAKVIDAVVAGETFTVTRHGKPVAELRPIMAHRPRFVPKAAIAHVAGRGPHIDRERFRADLDSLAAQDL